MISPRIKHALQIIDEHMSEGYPAENFEDWQTINNLFQLWTQRMEEVKEDTKCFVTQEMALSHLLDIEEKLAEKLNLVAPVREQLIQLNKNNLLTEDELVAEWHAAYAWFINNE